MNKRFLPVVIAAGFFLAITRGWAIFIAFPFWVVSTLALLYGIGSFTKLKQSGSAKVSILDTLLFYIWPLFYLATLLCIVSGGDTPGVGAFGFFTVDGSSAVAHLSSQLSLIFGAVFAGLTIVVVFEIQRIQQHIHQQPLKKRLIFLICLAFAVCFLIYCARIFIFDDGNSNVHSCDGKIVPISQYCNTSEPPGSVYRSGSGSGADVQTILVR